MHLHQNDFATLTVALAAFTLSTSALAQDKPSAPAEAKSSASGAPSQDDMAKMMALSKPNENHKLLGHLAGNWSYKVKFWMAPGAPPTESSGTSTCKPVMDGRYFVTNSSGKFNMPGPDGQIHPMDFQGMATDAYDNMKGKFISTWIDNMGTGVLISEGTYDPATKTFTYLAEEEESPGEKVKTREVIKLEDQNHYSLEWFQSRGGPEVKTMQIDYTRKG